MRHIACLAFLTTAALAALAADKPQPQPYVWDVKQRGALFSGTVMSADGKSVVAAKGLSICVDPARQAYVCFDTDTMRLAQAWTGDFLEFGKTQDSIQWPPPPKSKGQVVFTTQNGPGWAKDGSFEDPRAVEWTRGMGPLPRDWAKFKGVYRNGDEIILSYTVGGVEVLEMPGVEYTETGGAVFTRTLRVGASRKVLTLLVAGYEPGEGASESRSKSSGANASATVTAAAKKGSFFAGLRGAGEIIARNGRATVTIPAHGSAASLKLLVGMVSEGSDAKAFAKVATSKAPLPDLSKLTQGAPAQFPQAVTTTAKPGTGDGAFVVDDIGEPLPNPWGAKTFFSGFDFLPDGRTVICSFHGDVWTASGLDAQPLDKIVWRRFATGLFQPLGLKVVDGKAFVTCRDAIIRLHDLNNDGEADYYEHFNNDAIVTENYHEFTLDLHTDRAGNFYYAKGAPWEPKVTSPHQGIIAKVSKDGAKFEVIATGLRAPNGMGMGPRDEITVSDNQGHWMPSSKVSLVKSGGFYGMVPAAQRPLTLRYADGREITGNPSIPEFRAANSLKGWDASMPLPTVNDQPIAWLPMGQDNSSGGQVWAGKGWGPLDGQMLFMSYGKCTLFNVLLDTVDGATQAAMVKFPFKFSSGVMRGRVNPKDGQIYLCGLKGWQNDAAREGGFHRVRYTGKPVTMPIGWKVKKAGIELTFATPLDAVTATDIANYAGEQWNYVYSGGYGSPEVNVGDAKKKGHEPLELTGAKLSADGRTLFLEIKELRPANQVKVKFNLKTKDGAPVSHELYGTIHKLPKS